jgi:hypothetical protein
MFTIISNKSKVPRCEFYSRLIGMSSILNYSNDDIDYLFKVNMMLS